MFISLAISAGAGESNLLPLLTLELDARPSVETLGLGLADAKALLGGRQAACPVKRHSAWPVGRG
jgi:hypothetical protein